MLRSRPEASPDETTAARPRLSLGAAAATTARAAESLYEITKVEPKVAVGGTGTASLTIKVKGGWHVNDEAPISVALTPPPGSR